MAKSFNGVTLQLNPTESATPNNDHSLSSSSESDSRRGRSRSRKVVWPNVKPEAVQKQQAGPAAAAAAVHHHASIHSKYETGTSGGGGVDKPMAWMKNATNDEAVADMAEAEMELDIQKKTWDASHRCRSRSRSRHIMERAR